MRRNLSFRITTNTSTHRHTGTEARGCRERKRVGYDFIMDSWQLGTTTAVARPMYRCDIQHHFIYPVSVGVFEEIATKTECDNFVQL